MRDDCHGRRSSILRRGCRCRCRRAATGRRRRRAFGHGQFGIGDQLRAPFGNRPGRGARRTTGRATRIACRCRDVLRPASCSARSSWWRVAAQHVERLRLLDHQPRGDVAAAIDIETHVDASELRRVEADLEAVVAGLGARGDLDREAFERHRRGRQRIGGVGILRSMRGRRDRLAEIASALQVSELAAVGRRVRGLHELADRACGLRALGLLRRMRRLRPARRAWSAFPRAPALRRRVALRRAPGRSRLCRCRRHRRSRTACDGRRCRLSRPARRRLCVRHGRHRLRWLIGVLLIGGLRSAACAALPRSAALACERRLPARSPRRRPAQPGTACKRRRWPAIAGAIAAGASAATGAGVAGRQRWRRSRPAAAARRYRRLDHRGQRVSGVAGSSVARLGFVGGVDTISPVCGASGDGCDLCRLRRRGFAAAVGGPVVGRLRLSASAAPSVARLPAVR